MNDRRFHAIKMSQNKRCNVKKINKSAAQGSRRVDLMFKQASLKAFTSDFDVFAVSGQAQAQLFKTFNEKILDNLMNHRQHLCSM